MSMMNDDIFGKFADICDNPGRQLKAYKERGKKIIGCLPMYCPEEIIYACGGLPFGLWGADIGISKAKEYMPAFFCGILQTELEMAVNRKLDGLDAVVLTQLCDSLKCFSQNITVAAPQLRYIYLQQPQLRSGDPARKFFAARLSEFADEIAAITGAKYTEASLSEAVGVYNENRTLLRRFTELAATHPATVTPRMRLCVIKSGYFCDRAEHNELLKTINSRLADLPTEKWKGKRVVTTGIIADSTEFLSALEENGIRIVADDVAHESRQFRTDVLSADIDGIAKRYLSMHSCSLLYGGVTQRAKLVAALAEKYHADGVICLMTKFCDPEEYDYPLLRDAVENIGVPFITIEQDKSIKQSGQLRTILQTFAEFA